MALLAAALALLLAPCGAVVVDDVTRINPIQVARVVRPRSVAEVQALVRRHRGPISIGGGRFSMGGQTATEDALQLDMRGLDQVLAVDKERLLVRAQAGATWRGLQDALDPHELSLKIMQSYSNFTVGGSLSVNVHGRYVNQGPLIRAVRSIKLVLADGSLVEASPAKNRELFYGAIGGYGGLGVIVEAELELEPNVRVERTHAEMPVAEYPGWFRKNVKGSATAVFHNADLLPPRFDRATAVTFSRTDKPVTVKTRLQPRRRLSLAGRAVAWSLSELPIGPLLHEKVLKPFWLRGQPVVWRNYEASYDAYGLEPTTRKWSTYVLEEYFVPVDRMGDFLPRMTEIFGRHGVNVLNVSIRHAEKDPGSLLAWARQECFAFVVYYKQGVTRAERTAVGVWTRELVDAVLASGGTYYLPYQPHARPDQFLRAYPRAPEFFALKRRVDPSYKFRNKLWDKYLPPPRDEKAEAVRARLARRPSWRRAEAQTVLTLPEWYVVFSADELAAHLRAGTPSTFPWFRSIGQFWKLYGAASRAERELGGFNLGYHAMIMTVGLSFTAEYALCGVYENTVGRVLAKPSAEDEFYARVAGEYARFIHDVPWYEFPFSKRFGELWTINAPWSLRRVERRLWLSLQLAGKAVWAKLIGAATGAAYAPEDLVFEAWARGGADPERAGVTRLERLGGSDALLRVPRYEKFQAALRSLAKADVSFVELAGNKRIALTVVAPDAWDGGPLWGDVLAQWPVLTAPGKKRVALLVPVSLLTQAVRELPKEGAEIDHAYDY